MSEEASVNYPSVQLPTGHSLHIYREGGAWCVWLNTEVADFDGLCIGVGDTREQAVAHAVEALETAVEQLQKPV